MPPDARYCHSRTLVHRAQPAKPATLRKLLRKINIRGRIGPHTTPEALNWQHALFLAPDAAGAIGNAATRPTAWEGLY